LAPPSLTSLFHSASVLTIFMKLTSTFLAMALRRQGRAARRRRLDATLFLF